MGYWDKKNKAEEVEEEEINPEDITLLDYENACEESLGELESAFRNRIKQEDKRFADVTDSGYWFAVCFSNRKQREEFMESLGLPTDLRYVDGRELARAIKRPVKSPDTEFPRTTKGSKEYLRFVMDEQKTHD